MSNNTQRSDADRFDPALIEAAMQRGRQERSKAFWSMLQAIFGRSEEHTASHSAVSSKGATAHC